MENQPTPVMPFLCQGFLSARKESPQGVGSNPSPPAIVGLLELNLRLLLPLTYSHLLSSCQKRWNKVSFLPFF